ncbi:uncharacterized protein LOC143452310 [Clavelina lepadiformis]|uniref:uncharacterized protein LOC143452310 n=1 Tax=Clavelina lepadiformis TaxID=159417 RepID=UPI004042D183
MSKASNLSTFAQNATSKAEVIEFSMIELTSSRPCILDGFCTEQAHAICETKLISDCEECNKAREITFVIGICTLGLSILVGNALIIAVGCQRVRSGIAQKIDVIKISLALADILTGVQIFVFVLPNFIMAMGTTLGEYEKQQHIKTVYIATGSVIMIFCITSSLFHLILLGLQRFYAIQLPFRYRTQSKRQVVVGLIVIWILAFLYAMAPVFFSSRYGYHLAAFMYIPVGKSLGAALGLWCSVIIFPFFLMVLLSIMTTIAAWWKFRRLRKLPDNDAAKCQQLQQTKRELHVFKMVAIMQCGVVVTIGPAVIMLLLLLVRTSPYRCDVFLTLMAGFIYFSLSNSLINVLVYSVRDKGFRQSVLSLLKSSGTSSSRILKTTFLRVARFHQDFFHKSTPDSQRS